MPPKPIPDAAIITASTRSITQTIWPYRSRIVIGPFSTDTTVVLISSPPRVTLKRYNYTRGS